MKNIQVFLESKDDAIYEVDEYSFVAVDSDIPAIPIYKMSIKQRFSSQLDFRFWIESIFEQIIYLLEAPAELTDYIKKYEECSEFNDICLFHDLRTKYLDIIKLDVQDVQNNIMLIGYTLSEEQVFVAVKSFNWKGLSEFIEHLIKYCNNHEIHFENKTNLKWTRIEQFILPDINQRRNEIFDSFLKQTLDSKYSSIFREAFTSIDSRGYLDKSFYDKEIEINGVKKPVALLQKFTKYFSPFWKEEREVKDGSKKILYLHEELLSKESLDKIVYAMKPSMMHYYQLHWFEDFCAEIISKTNHLDVVDCYCGRQFNFFQSGIHSDIREIDLLVGVQRGSVYRIIAIECKKTLTSNEIKNTNKKIKDKILSSKTNLIDAYIHIGCFNNGVEFDRRINRTKESYKQGLVQIEDPNVKDAPYFAFTASKADSLKTCLSHLFNEIIEQW